MATVNQTDEFPLSSYFPDTEDQRIFAVICNYLLLSQFDVARRVIDEYFQVDPERIIRILRTLFTERITDHADWCAIRLSSSIIPMDLFSLRFFFLLFFFLQAHVQCVSFNRFCCLVLRARVRASVEVCER